MGTLCCYVDAQTAVDTWLLCVAMLIQTAVYSTVVLCVDAQTAVYNTVVLCVDAQTAVYTCLLCVAMLMQTAV